MAKLGGEKGSVQTPLIQYASDILWQYVAPEEALRLRGGNTGFVFKDPEPGNRIDWILVSKAVGVRSHRTLIARSLQGYLSDHLPVVAELILH